MLVWSRSGRFIVWLVAALLIGVIFIAPLAVILLSSLAEQWSGVLPTGLTLDHYAQILSGDSGEAVRASLITGFVASGLALLSGTWAALALRLQSERWRKPLGWLYFIPSAVPSVSVGLGLLVAFSQRPILLNGMTIMDVSYSAQNLVKGVVLLAAVIADSFLNPRNEETAQQGDI